MSILCLGIRKYYGKIEASLNVRSFESVVVFMYYIPSVDPEPSEDDGTDD